MRRALFLSGETTLTLPMCMTRKAPWDHRTSPAALHAVPPDAVRRGAAVYHAVLCYFSLDDDALREDIHRTLQASNVACWPAPAWLRAISDRRDQLARAQAAGLVDHPIVVVEREVDLAEACREVGFPAVVKIGNAQGGLGKHLVQSEDDVTAVQSQAAGSFATVEPFFDGESFRLFVAGAHGFETTVCIRYDNQETWVKNAPGCEVARDVAPPEAIASAILAHQVFQHASGTTGTLLSGVDYVREHGTGAWRFLEWNGFPWLANDPDVEALGRTVLEGAMTDLERHL